MNYHLIKSQSQADTLLDSDPKSSIAPPGQPIWIAFDRQVLRFYAYFQEAVQERREERYRVRKVSILFYLEDDTIHVIEPRSQNSGIPQGTLIRRHRIPAVVTELPSKRFFGLKDFNVGNEITFYGKTFKIVGCDGFTRMLSRMRPTRPAVPKLSLKKFLENDRKVLRFYCVWDDTNSAFGETRQLILHYFLADDTIEIREHIPANSGRDGATNFLKRCKLPKKLRASNANSGTGSDTDDYYTDRDLMIGAIMTVYGRHVLICDCDEFTKEYYKERYEIDDFEPILYSQLSADASGQSIQLSAPQSAPSLPPHNGIGSEEDSLNSCTNLIPKPPRKDFKKFMQYDSMVLRYAGILNTNNAADKDRKFVITYYLADDTIQIFEPHQKNSGILSGKFLERSKVKVPKGTDHYTTKDFYIGAQLMFSAHPFIIVGADEYAIKYMDSHPNEFPNHHREHKHLDKDGKKVRFEDKTDDEANVNGTSQRTAGFVL
ncbi:hypothetical protein BKA69DRAFT_1108755 [Paraphysoderma sedebokerense]|nr:hypothetical protein BKA69DRAFT_1108755 [Paraphysoderma sedebokerense]